MDLKFSRVSFARFILFVVFSLTSSMSFAQTQSTVCAVVKIEIVQELTIERQAFEATLNIENTLADKTITDINVVVDFQDENGNPVVATSDPNDTSAKFFIRVNSLEGINDISGNGTLDGGEIATATWLIIPAPGSSDGIPSGKLYFVGASFQYKLDGIADSIEVAPDTIYVKPLPLLSLDYFLPRDVFADNPLTTEVEPPEPFTLGVRVQNNGQGVGKNIKIESAQPKIVENDQGLLIDFLLLNSFVQNQSINNSLLIEFGDILSGESKVGRWNMQTSLSGRFTDFSAEYSHADDLGGQLTSLLESVNTHTLVRDVLVDLQGRDDVKDFLAYEVFDPLTDNLEGLKVYESNSTTSVVDDQSTTATLQQSGGDYQVSLSPSPGFVYAQLDDPFSGGKAIGQIVRSDGKVLSANNYWFSKSYNKTTKEISYHFNIFDVDTTGQYEVLLTDPIVVPRAPVLQFISLKSTFEGNPLSFAVQASDPDRTIPALTLINPPQGLLLTEQGDGTGEISWTPGVGQAGRYEFQVQASDGVLTDQNNVVIVVNSALDTDGDGLLDAWEIEQFGNLNNDGSADTDGDGVSDLEEFERDTDPNVADGPLAPQILEPVLEGFVATKTPELIVTNSEYIGSFDVVYAYEVYSDGSYTELVDAFYAQPEDDSGETSWQTRELEEDTTYYWRVRAFDSFTYSPWVNGRFRVNSENSLPEAPTLNYPTLGAEVFIDQLKLVVNTVTDADGDELFYKFSLYEEQIAETLLAESDSLPQSANNPSGQVEWQIPESISLQEGRDYYWRAEVMDVAGVPVKTDVFNFVGVSKIVLSAPRIRSPEKGIRVNTSTPVFIVSDTVDRLSGDTISYLFEIDTASSFDSVNKITSDWVANTDDDFVFSWEVPTPLDEDVTYYWRVRSRSLVDNESEWASSDFIINAENQAPAVPVINNPGNDSQVITLTPKLAVFPSEDPDQDQVTYQFELYADVNQQQLLVSSEVNVPELMLEALDDDKWYFWRVRAIDEKEETSEWTTFNRFFVNENNIDNEPEFIWLIPEQGTEVIQGESLTLRWEDSDPDSSAYISLYFADNPEGVDRQQIAEGLSEDEDNDGDTFEWSSNGLNAGNYYFFAVIEDATNVTSVASEQVFNVSVKDEVIADAEPIGVESVSGDGASLYLQNLIDQDYETPWVHWSQGESTLEFDFSTIKRLDNIKIAFASPRLIRYRYSIETSIDGSNWTKIVDTEDLAIRFWTENNEFTPLNARYVRLTIHSAHAELNTYFGKRVIPVRLKSIYEVLFEGGEPFSD